MVAQRLHISHNYLRIELADDIAHRHDKALRIAGSVNHKHRGLSISLLQSERVEGTWLLLQRLPRVIAYDADNLTRHFRSITRHLLLDEVFPERRTTPKIPLHKRFIDYRDTRRAFPIALVKITALDD